MIKAEIVADSLSPQGDRLISVLCTFPRIILAEVNTHRMLSKNTSSSRAIPFEKMVEAVQNNPFIPIAWQIDHKSMQGTVYKEGDSEIQLCVNKWLEARDNAIMLTTLLNNNELVTKQLCNRLLEPFMWTTMLITGSREGWENFFNLRCPQYGGNNSKNQKVYFKSKKETLQQLQVDGVDISKLLKSTDLEWQMINKGQAEIHMMALAEAMWDAMNESIPKKLESGEFHLPFIEIEEDLEITK